MASVFLHSRRARAIAGRADNLGRAAEPLGQIRSDSGGPSSPWRRAPLARLRAASDHTPSCNAGPARGGLAGRRRTRLGRRSIGDPGQLSRALLCFGVAARVAGRSCRIDCRRPARAASRTSAAGSVTWTPIKGKGPPSRDGGPELVKLDSNALFRDRGPRH